MRISHSFFAASFSRLALFFSFFLFSFHIFAQSALRGNVADEKGKALPGANIRLLKPEKVVISDENGNFAIENLPQGNYEIKISFIGFKPETRSVSLTEADAAVLIRMTETGTWLNSVEISAPKEMPFTTAVLSKKELAKNNLAQDMPFLLQNTPSVVSMSDGGTGVGYTNMRIRGSDNTRTNVTINGIPVNDAESQGVWWVNMPDFASSLESVQIQRGVGTSVNGAGAFGASVNLSTAAASEKSYVEIGNTIGSFNTFRHNIKFGTGKINQFFSLDARLSKVQTDGYIDNAWAKMKSFFVTGAFEKGKTKMTLNLFGGNELTFQAWNGVSAEKILAGERRYNELAAYDNEVDNYSQEHFQWIIDQKIGNQWQLYAAAHFTRGRGYFEQYKAEQKLKNYGLEEIVLKDTLIKKTDLIRRRWLDNYFYGALANLSYNSKTIIGGQSALLLNFGAGYNRYEGKHFGEVIWAKNMSNGNIRHRYYDNDAVKSELNAFAKAQYQFFEGFFAFADVQIRSINYEFLGYTAALQQMPQNVGYTFFNPKSGLRYVRGENEFYFSFARANREPNRDDFTNSSTESRPKFETLNNTEAGWQKSGEKLTLSANYYLMQYQNQLILTGKINDVGAYVRQNVEKSYRQGIEVSGRYSLTKNLSFFVNAAISENKIVNFTEFLDEYDENWEVKGQKEIFYAKTDIAFSPNLLAGAGFDYSPFRDFGIALTSRYVGKQFLDNTASEKRKTDAFFVADLRLNYALNFRNFAHTSITLLVNNLTNEMYAPNGYTYGWYQGGERTSVNYFYPQAGRNFLLGVQLIF